MGIYKKLYFKLFNDITEVTKMVGELQSSRVGKQPSTIEVCELSSIIDKLKDIQLQAENMYLDSEETK